MTQPQSAARKLFEAYEAGEDLTLPSAASPDLSMADAYAIQESFVALRLDDDELAGFKAGLTAPAAQQSFGVSHPVTGALLRSGERRAGATIQRADFRALLLETELGFRVGATITQPVADTAALRESIAACLPMVELAELCYGPAPVSGADLVAANTASAAFIRGALPNWRDFDLNKVEVTFTRDGETLHQATAGDVMGDQWQALQWLVNEVIGQGYVIEPGMYLMTGSMGPPHPGEPGDYLADYGAFGKITFTVTE